MFGYGILILYREKCELIKKLDFRICSVSNISLEYCGANLPIIIGYAVKNQ
tara:strand:- start:17 stop:169 length:153 start_codon:yes stop_codon:yes gene_type:complete